MGAGDSVLAELQSGEPFPTADAGCTPKSRTPHKIIKSRLEKLRFAGGGGGGSVSSSKSYDAVANGSDTKGMSLGKKISKTLSRGVRRGGSVQSLSLSSTPTGSQYSMHTGAGSHSLDGSMLGVYEVEGASGHKNSVIVSPSRAATAEKNVVFFPGDVQDFTEIMSRDARLRTWASYSYEFAMDRLEARYPDANIILVIPSRKHLGAYSCYDNFLDTDQLGSPAARTAENKAHPQLFALLNAIQAKCSSADPRSTQSLPGNTTMTSGTEALLEDSPPSATLPDRENRAPMSPLSKALHESMSVDCSPCTSVLASPTSSPRPVRLRAATADRVAVAAPSKSSRKRPTNNDSPGAATITSSTDSQALDGFDASLPVTVVGFSKGCTVLNQLAAEMHADAASLSRPVKHYTLRRLCSKSRELRTQLSLRESSADDDSDAGSVSTNMKASNSNADLSSGVSSVGGADDGHGIGVAGGGNRVISSQAVTSILHRKLSRRSRKSDDASAGGDDGGEETWPKAPWDKVAAFVWLDGGHSGSQGAWVTDEETIKTLKSTLTSLEVHSSPYQVNNDREVWKRHEYVLFRHFLHVSSHVEKAQINIFDHSTQDEPSIKVHFRVLDVF